MKRGDRKRVVLAGGTGYLGQLLAWELVARDYDVVVLTRRAVPYHGPGRAVLWNGKNADYQWVRELDGAAAVVNLAGKNVNCRPTTANREEIASSRLDSVAAIGEALRFCETPPPAWVQASSLAIYGDAGDVVCNDFGRAAHDYPADVCVDWERMLGLKVMTATRWVALRIGFVLGRGGGALPLLERLARRGLGGRMGSGKQWISWIHEADMVRVFVRAIESESMWGTYNATSPEPMRNADFMREVRTAVGRGWQPPAPAAFVRLGARLMGADAKIALTGRRAVPWRLADESFRFRFSRLEAALRDLHPREGYEVAEAIEGVPAAMEKAKDF